MTDYELNDLSRTKLLELNNARKGRKLWKKIVRVLSAVVVFCTTYALILPAITMHTDPVCGMDEHAHSQDCYGTELICTTDLTGAAILHSHEGYCYDGAGALICTLPEVISHQHSDDCYEVRTAYLCGHDETDGHTHLDSCYEILTEAVCGFCEQEAHVHADACYGQPQLNCGQDESEGHSHGEGCYELQITQNCGLIEQEAHIHGDDCYRTEDVISCGLEEEESHVHGDDCYVTERILSCGLQEEEPHSHGDACYEMKQVICCGMEEDGEHVHEEGCYRSEYELVCVRAETQGHIHDDSCCTEEKQLVCIQPETGGHTHMEDCHREEHYLICTLEENEGHTHTDACNLQELVLICTDVEMEPHSHEEGCYETPLLCGLEESQGHAHEASCYQNLICTETEIPAHAHSEDCTVVTAELLCGLEEIIPHSHGEACLDAEGNPVCGLDEYTEHIHHESCVAQVTVCAVLEHTHDESCYPVLETQATEPGFLCGFGSHVHGPDCYDSEGILSCSIPEHTHTAPCVVEDYDPLADLESAEDWESQLAGLDLTGSWPENVRLIAQSQLGYRESEKNVELREDGSLRGYTRYGAWYGDPYGDWSGMFAAFCVDYAGVRHLPLDADANTWAGKLREIGYYRISSEYTPKSGDLVFLDLNGDGKSERVGLISDSGTNSGMITAVEGDSNGQVQTCTYTNDDRGIVGFGVMPLGENRSMTCRGDDYTVVVEFDSDARIPADACLEVREIEAGTEEYDFYYQQSLQALQDSAADESEQDISFARFFDISFLVGGQTVEPAAPVRISIVYTEAVSLGEDDSGVAIHFADEGIEILDAETRQQDSDDDSQADTFIFTQDSFSVTGTVVTGGTNGSILADDLSGATNIMDVCSDVLVLNASGTQASFFVHADAFSIELEGTAHSYRFSGNDPLTFYLTLDPVLKLNAYTCTDTVSTARINGSTNTFIMTVDPVRNGNGYQDVPFRVKLEGQVEAQSSGTSYVTIRWTQYAVYSQKQEFVCELPDGSRVLAGVLAQGYSPEEYRLVVEQVDVSNYLNNISNYIVGQFNRRELEEAVMYRINLQRISDPNVQIALPAPYEMSITYPQSPVHVPSQGDATVLNMNNGSASRPSAASAVTSDGGVEKAGISDQYTPLSYFAVASFGGIAPGTTGSGYALSYNEQSDAFIRDPAYASYYNANSPIGTAGSFHIVAFDTANLDTHTNGNILAKNLNANSNFGTNNYDLELTYVQNYLKINSNSASKNEHILVIGSENAIGFYDNNNKYTINGQPIDRPKNLIQDRDTASAPFIDLDRVKSEIRQISRSLVGYSDRNLQITYMDQKNVIALTNPDSVGILNVTPSDASVFGKDYIQLAGFQKGYNGSIVINVDCSGVSQINLPKALVVVDGQEQGTNEVTEFSNGKVLWNFINAQGVTINTHLMTGMVIAPGATVNITQNLNGTVVADVVNVKAESHRTDFTGKIVPYSVEDDHTVTIQKIRSGYVGTTLANACFDLYIWNGQDWQKVNSQPMVTDSKGLFRMRDLQTDTAYMLVETVAPVGYQLMEEPYYFWVQNTRSVSVPRYGPDGFTGNAVPTGSVLNIPNEPDVQVETTQIELEKIWDTDQPVTVKTVEVNLYQLVWLDDHQIQRELYKTVTLSAVLGWNATVSDLPLSGTDAEGNTLTYTYGVEEVPVEGFAAEYSIDQAAGISEGKIVITNRYQSEEGYVLPETGGDGNRTYTFGGLLIIAFAFMYFVVYPRWRRREACP